MKTILSFVLALISCSAFSQSIQGTWQLTDSKTCFQTNMQESDTEKEITSMMDSNSTSTVAKLIIFKTDGSGQEGIFSVGEKKGSVMQSFQYKSSVQELNFTDQ